MTKIIDTLESYMKRPVIFADQASPKPTYPYLVIKETSQLTPAPGQPAIKNEPLIKDISQVAISQPTKTLSITAYSRDMNEATELAQMAHSWFTFTGYRTLKDDGLIVVDVTTINNRDSLIIDDYERRRGFDVTLRFLYQQERFVEEILIVDQQFKRSD